MSKTVLITGATAGIGAAAARAFVGAGWNVIGTGRRRDRLDGLAGELGDAFRPLELDMREIDSFPAALAGQGEIDWLVNNAGLAPPMTGFQDSKLDDGLNVIQTNITGLIALTRQLLPGLIARQGGIINLSSVAATYPYRGGAIYAATKAFVRQFSLDLRCDLHGTGVRVTSIEPGMVETEFTLVRTGGNQDASDKMYGDMQPMTGEDIAGTILWTATLPAHLNINTLELMPVAQSFAGFAVARDEAKA